jgi:HK97 family phage prohead protease
MGAPAGDRVPAWLRDVYRTAHTAEASTVHEPIGKPGGPGLWHHKTMQLPAYIQHVAHHLIAQGHDESTAIEEAVGIVKNWAAGHDGHGQHVHPDVQAAAAKNIADWEALKAKAHASTGARRSTVAARAEMTTQSINDLPDSDFAYIEPGGSKDSSGKTVPRSLRHFPIHDAAHVRNALARAPQSPFGSKAMGKIRDAARKFGIDAGGDSGSSGGAARLDPYTMLAVEQPYMRIYPLEDMHILRSADGGNGRIVEAYAAVFDDPAEIQDHEGHYVEVIDPNAFDTAIHFANRNKGGLAANVKVLYNHGMTVQGSPSERGSMPIGVPVDVRAEGRGLLTRTEYNKTPLAEEVLENIRAGSITSQSFTGRIIRSDPQLRRGDRYRPGPDGQLRTVRRVKLGLREYGPVLWPAYSGAEILGVRMSTPGSILDPDDFQALPPDEGPVSAGSDPLPPLEHSARYHQHALYVLRSQEARQKAGLVW